MAALAVRVAVLVRASWPYTPDDAWITLRYARHLAAGHGIVWNPGEPPIEGYSNPLSMLLGALAHRLELDPMLTLKLVGVAALAVSLALVVRLARLWLPLPAALAPAFLLTLYPGTFLWAVSGLETTLYLATMLGVTLAAAHGLGYRPAPFPRAPESAGGFVLAGLLVGLASAIRPEGPVLGVALGLALLTRPRALLVVAATAAGPVLALTLFRLAYFHAWVPHSVACKAAYTADPVALLRTPALLGALALLGIAAGRSWDARHTFAVVLLILYGAVLYRVDPVMGGLLRYSLPALTVLLTVATASALARARQPARLVAIAAVLLACSVPLEARALAAGHREYAARDTGRRAVAAWLTAHLSPTDRYVIGDAGLVPYLTPRPMLDAYCLNSPAMTALGRDPDRYARWLLAQSPRAIVVQNTAADRLQPYAILGVYPALVALPAFHRDYHFVASVPYGRSGYYRIYEHRSPDYGVSNQVRP